MYIIPVVLMVIFGGLTAPDTGAEGGAGEGGQAQGQQAPDSGKYQPTNQPISHLTLFDIQAAVVNLKILKTIFYELYSNIALCEGRRWQNNGYLTFLLSYCFTGARRPAGGPRQRR